MNGFFNTGILVLLVFCLVCAVVGFGGIDLEYIIPMYASAAALVILWSAKLVLARQVSWSWSPMHALVMAFTVYATIRYFMSPIEYASRVELLQVGMYAIVYFATAFNLHHRRDRDVIVVVLMVVALGQSMYSLWQYAAKRDVVLWLDRPDQYHGRGSGTYVCPNHLAGFLEIVLGMVLARIVIARSPTQSIQRNVLVKFFEIYVALFVIAGLFSTLSRGGWIAAAGALLLFLLWAGRAHAVSSNVIAAGVLACLVAAGVAISLPSVRHRLAEAITFRPDYRFDYGPLSVKDPTMEGRVAMWQATLKIVRDHPLLGTGPGTWLWAHLKYRDPRFQGRPEFAHGDVLHLASDYGAIGLVLVLVMFVCFFRVAMRLSAPINPLEQSAFAVGAMTAVSAILLHSIVDFNMHIPANALLILTLMGLTTAMDNDPTVRSRTEMPRAVRIVLALALLAVTATGLRAALGISLASRNMFLGTSFKEVNAWDTALGYFTRAVKWDPKSPELWARIGDVYRVRSALRVDNPQGTEQQDLAARAQSAYLQSVALNPYESEVWLRLAIAYELAGEIAQARSCYDQALAVDPNNVFSFLRLGIFLLRNGDELAGAAALHRSAQLGSVDAVELLQDLRAGNSQP